MEQKNNETLGCVVMVALVIIGCIVAEICSVYSDQARERTKQVYIQQGYHENWNGTWSKP